MATVHGSSPTHTLSRLLLSPPQAPTVFLMPNLIHPYALSVPCCLQGDELVRVTRVSEDEFTTAYLAAVRFAPLKYELITSTSQWMGECS